jgi:hypothetical protein
MNLLFYFILLLSLSLQSAFALKKNCDTVYAKIADIGIGTTRGATFPIPQLITGYIDFLKNPSSRTKATIREKLVVAMEEKYGTDVDDFIQESQKKSKTKSSDISEKLFKELLKKFPLNSPEELESLEYIGLAKTTPSENRRAMFVVFTWVGIVLLGIDDSVKEKTVDQKLPNFEETKENESMVILDLFEDNLRNMAMKSALKEKYQTYLKNPKTKGKVIYLEIKDVWNVPAELLRIKKEYGPIARFEVATHGSAGRLSDSNKGFPLEELLGNRPLDVFASGAQVKFTSCNLALGSVGKKAINDFYNMHLKKGDTLVASQLGVWGSRLPSPIQGAPGFNLIGAAFRYFEHGELGLTWRLSDPSNQVIVIRR